MVKKSIWVLVLIFVFALSSCGKKGPVRPKDSDLSHPVQTQPTNDCSG